MVDIYTQTYTQSSTLIKHKHGEDQLLQGIGQNILYMDAIPSSSTDIHILQGIYTITRIRTTQTKSHTGQFFFVLLFLKLSWQMQTHFQAYTFTLMLHNGGFCHGCVTKRCLHNSKRYHIMILNYNCYVIKDVSTQ